jgi:putative mRNA 3-end processing factor
LSPTSHEPQFRARMGHDGAILLGDVVCCDGFHSESPLRVQTHVHQDHLIDFARSKGFQDIALTPASFELLVALFDADLPYRKGTNILPLEFNQPITRSKHTIELAPTGHMLGCAQVRVTLPDGYRIGYSSDFSWPVPQKVLECDELVVDATYGDPGAVRDYTRDHVNERLLQIVTKKVMDGPVLFFGHRGRIQGAMEFLGSSLRDVPLYASPRHLDFAKVYQQFGHEMRDPLPCDSAEAIDARIKKRRGLFFFALDEFDLAEPREDAYSVTLSAYMVPKEDPVLEYAGGRGCRVALTDHADFNGTVEFVRASGARRVLTDASRGGNAVALAAALREILKVDALPLQRSASLAWGQ